MNLFVATNENESSPMFIINADGGEYKQRLQTALQEHYSMDISIVKIDEPDKNYSVNIHIEISDSDTVDYTEIITLTPISVY